jgi:hypothetical protein
VKPLTTEQRIIYALIGISFVIYFGLLLAAGIMIALFPG